MNSAFDLETRALGFPPKPMIRDAKSSKYYRCIVQRLDYRKGGQVLLMWEYMYNRAAFWLPFSSERIWLGSYKHRDWLHQGEGAWKPTSAAQQALAAQEPAIRKSQQLAVARGGSISSHALLKPAQRPTAPPQQQQQQSRPPKRELQQSSHGRPPKQPRRSPKQESPDAPPTAHSSLCLHAHDALLAEAAALGAGPPLQQGNQSSSRAHHAVPELQSASSEAVAAGDEAVVLPAAADAAATSSVAACVEQDTASTGGHGVPAAASRDQQLEQEQPVQQLQHKPLPEQHLAGTGPALLPDAQGRRRARTRIRQPAAETAGAAGAIAGAEAGAVPADRGPACMKPQEQTAEKQSPIKACVGRASGLNLPAVPATATAAAAELELSKPEWFSWLQLAATDPQAALSGAGPALQHRIRHVRQQKRVWAKAKLHAEPQMSPGRSRSVQAPAVAAPLPDWVLWLRQAASRDPAAVLATSYSDPAMQQHLKSCDDFVRARAQAAVAQSWLSEPISEAALSHLRQHSSRDVLTLVRQLARSVEAAAAAAAAQGTRAPSCKLGSPAAEIDSPGPDPAAEAAAPGTIARKPRRAARLKQGNKAVSAKAAMATTAQFSTGAAAAVCLLRRLQLRLC